MGMNKDKDGFWVIYRLHPDDITGVIIDEEYDVPEPTAEQMDEIAERFQKVFEHANEDWSYLLGEVIEEVMGK
jgi:hypothetical protein